MNTPADDFDPVLAARFRQERTHLPHDPFVGITARRIAAARRRRGSLRYALQAAAVAALVLGSHWLIQASALASTKLDAWFTVGIDWLVTPLGTVAVLAGVITVAAARRWRSHRGV